MISIIIEVNENEFKQCLFCAVRDATGELIDTQSLTFFDATSNKEEVIEALIFLEYENITSIKIVEEETDEPTFKKS